MPKARFDINRYARLGAESRLRELEEEINAIRAAYPDLGGSPRRGRGASNGAPKVGERTTRKRRPKMTAAQKKAVSLRMKKYWADRRKANSDKRG